MNYCAAVLSAFILLQSIPGTCFGDTPVDTVIHDCALSGDTIWASTSDGVFEISIEDKSYHQLLDNTWGVDHDLGEIVATADGTVATVFADGISFYDGSNWQSFDFPSAAETITSLHTKPNGDIIFLYQDDLYRYRDNNLDIVSLPDSMVVFEVYVSETSDEIWCMTSINYAGFLSQYRNGTWKRYELENTSRSIFINIVEATENNVYICYRWNWRNDTSHVALLIDSNGATQYAARGWHIGANSRVQADGIFWYFTRGNYEGLSLFDGNSWTPVTPENYGLTDTLYEFPELTDMDMSDDGQGRMYYLLSPIHVAEFDSSPKVLSRYDHGTWDVFTPEQGAPEHITGILGPDGTGRMWLSTTNGIASLAGASWSAYAVNDSILYAEPVEDRLLFHTETRVGLIDTDVTWCFDAPLGVEAEEKSNPEPFALVEAYPNPFNPSTTIQITMTRKETCRLDVFNVLGQQVASLYDGLLTPGIHTFQFDGSSLGSGLYVTVLRSSSQKIVTSMTLSK